MTPPPIRVRIFYPADPMGVVPGGVDTFLRGLIKFAPDDLEFSLVGMSTNLSARPLGHWTRCHLGNRSFDFYPVVAQKDAGQRTRVPLAVRYSIALRQHMQQLDGGFDVFDFHRIEPSLLFTADRRPKNFYFHNDPSTLRLAASDNLWKHAPHTYERLEARALHDVASVWCVRQSGVELLRRRYPDEADRIRFIPTWVDAEVFHPAEPDRRAALRRAKSMAHGLDHRLPWVVSVGRLDTQKDPALMLRALARLRRTGTLVHWLVIGDGVLRPMLERKAEEWGLSKRVHFLGLLSPREIADWLRACDAYALTSAYEGMPMALLEALGSGLPAVVTDVGEVRRVVHPGLNGAIAEKRSSRAVALALQTVIDDLAQLSGGPACAAVAAFAPADVLAPAYQNYRRLGASLLVLRLAAERARAEPPAEPLRQAVGIPIAVVNRAQMARRVLGWAREQESRYVCFVNVHSSVVAARDERHRLALIAADLALPDGAPIAWTVGVKERFQQQRIDGPGSMWSLCGQAADIGIKVGLYGSSLSTLQALERRLRDTMPHLQLAYRYAPPYREMTDDEDATVCARIAESGVGLLFVGLGCPKQEHWMAAHRGRVPAVMLGVGAAFDFHAGTVGRAPTWMRDRGLEWLHRMGTEPRRLGGRYLQSNTMFIAKTVREFSRSFTTASAERSTPTRRRQTHSSTFSLPPLAPPSRGMRVLEMGPRRSRDEVVDTIQESCPYEPSVKATIDLRPFENLVGRVESVLPAGRVVGFIASGVGEGTSTMARAYVAAAAARLPRRVLLLETHSDGIGSGVMQALAAQRPLNMLLRPLLGGGMAASLGGIDAQRAVIELATRAELWQELRRHFDEIVLDLPASSASSLGLTLAPHCDGVVVVLEAGKTRAPVVQHLVAELRALRANIMGTVLNKRRYPVPAAIYRLL